MIQKYFLFSFRFIFLFNLFIFLASCGTDYKDFSNENGRQAVIDEANNYLTSMMCDHAIDVLKPLYESPYVTNEVKMVYASAYACKAGFSFVKLVVAMKNGSSDIWSVLVSSLYSRTQADGESNATSLETASHILRQTSNDPTTFESGILSKDANVLLIFIHASIIATVISPLGVADQTTGKKTVSNWPTSTSVTDRERCRTEVAIATIYDALRFVTVSSGLSTLSTKINAICGGACPTNKNKDNCSAAEHVVGQAALVGIDSQWTLL